MFPLRFPFFYSPNYYNFRRYPSGNYNFIYTKSGNPHNENLNLLGNNLKALRPAEELTSSKKNNSKSNSNEDYFLELFGLKLFFDDILIVCLIFFLYDEGVKDNELFISLILLLLS